MDLLEILKKPFLKQPDEEQVELSSEVTPDNTVADLSDEDLYPNTGAFFDAENNGLFGTNQISETLEKQKIKIMQYRNMAKNPDVADAIEEIVNEVIFSLGDETPIKIDVDEENEKLQEAIADEFEFIVNKMNIKKNMHNIVKNSYVDGQLKIHMNYGKNVKEGVHSLKIMEPVYLMFDKKKKVYKYYNKENNEFFKQTGINRKEEYNIDEIVSADFGLYEDGINLGYLENAIKTSNQLKTLEDLLIPMRFSRSISRRVFNVDISDLPNKKGQAAMQEMQTKFKYKKHYNTETGEVSNQQHIASMVEDYWFANRNGAKGTTVDVLDETGNLGELNDILYFYKKLYKSLKIPSNRVPNNPDQEGVFNYDDTQVTKEDMKFFIFISRLRQVFSSLIKEVLKRQVISKEIMSETEWDENEDKIKVIFTNENSFIEKMNLDNFMSKLDIYATAKEHKDVFGIEKLLMDIFKMTEDEVKELIKKVKKEKTNPLYKEFYASEDDGF